jgi:hypothetical protein
VEKLDNFQNKTFEHRKNTDITAQTEALSALRTHWLPLKDLFCNYKITFNLDIEIIKIFSDNIRSYQI